MSLAFAVGLYCWLYDRRVFGRRIKEFWAIYIALRTHIMRVVVVDTRFVDRWQWLDSR